MRDDAFCEGVRTLLKEAAAILPVRGLGVVHEDGFDHVILTYVDGLGATAYRCRADEIVEALRPRHARRVLTTIDLNGNPDGLFESKLLVRGFAEGIRQEFHVHQTVAIAIPDGSEPATLVIAISTPDPLTADQKSGIEQLARRVIDFVHETLPVETERERSRRLEAVAGILPALVRVLDIREIFDHLSTIAKDVLRHDFASIGVFGDNRARIDLYVQTSGGPFEFRSGRMPFPTIQTDHWLYRFVDDLRTSPLEREGESIRGGGQASIRVAIRFDDTIIGAMNFTSRDPAPYTATDLAVCRRIAEYVAIALSHQRLAEEARVSEQLRARAANLELLDELLATLSDTGELEDVFARVSTLARKVLPHDALALQVFLPNGRARQYSNDGTSAGNQSGIAEVPGASPHPDWEFDVI